MGTFCFFENAECPLFCAVVRQVRDLVRQPLTPQEFLRRPNVYRGRHLIRGWCSDGKWRQFYLSSTREEFRVVPHKIALFSEDQTRLLRIVPLEFGASMLDRIRLATQLRRLVDNPPEGLLVRVIVDDLRLVSPQDPVEQSPRLRVTG